MISSADKLKTNSEYSKMSLGLGRISIQLKAFGNPQDRFRSIHVAGTNGKGTVCRALHYALSAQGLKVGLFTSPHLVCCRERIQVGNEHISDHDFCLISRQIIQTLNLTVFEQYTAVAFEYFSRQKIDIAIVEVGLGGRLDATNLIKPVASVVTNIGLDHQEVLGNGLLAIAKEKIAIFKQGVPAVVGEPSDAAVKDLIIQEAKVKDCTLIWANPSDNYAIAKSVLDNLNETCYRSNFADIDWSKMPNPGRQQVVSTSPFIMLDGAHNPAAADFLVSYLLKHYPDHKFCFVVGILRRKDANQIIKRLARLARRFIFVPICGYDCYSPTELSQILKGEVPWQKCDDLSQAVSLIVEEKNKHDWHYCVTGSLYLLGEFIEKVRLN